MKTTLAAAFRAIVFGVCAFLFIALLRIKIFSSWDVAGFILGATVLWYLFETVVVKALGQKKSRKSGLNHSSLFTLLAARLNQVHQNAVAIAKQHF
ncbi:MAG: hypothetical protein EXR11_07415 [Rhodospirillaceae bacterium]|nr:hypothetical protein [Rhodospirillaceae bacterium]